MKIKLFLAALIITLSFNINAQAASNSPLVILRFNNKNVQFENSLSNALAQALAKKPGVRLNVQVSSAANKNNAAEYEAKVLNVIKNSGITPERINVTRDNNSQSGFAEFYIYVE